MKFQNIILSLVLAVVTMGSNFLDAKRCCGRQNNCCNTTSSCGTSACGTTCGTC